MIMKTYTKRIMVKRFKMKNLILVSLLLIGTVLNAQEINLRNEATIGNSETDTLDLTETVVKVSGDLLVGGQTLTTNHSCALVYVSTPGIMTINTGATYEKLDEGAIAYTAGHLHNFTHDDGKLTYTGAATLHFTIVVSITVESGESAQVVQFRLAKGGTPIAGTNMSRTFRATSTDSAIPLNWLTELATNEYIEVYGTSDTNADNFTIVNLTLTVGTH